MSTIFMMPSILIFVEYFLPGFKSGGPVHSVSNLVELLRDDYTIFLVTRDRDYMDEVPYDIESNNWIYTNGCQIFYISPSNINYSSIKNLINSINADFIYVNSLYGGFSRIILIYSLFNQKKVIIAPRGELHKSAISIKSYKKIPYIQLVKLISKSNLVTWHATNEEESFTIRKAFFKLETEEVFVKLAPDTPKMLKMRRHHKKDSNLLKLVFASRIAPIKNIFFLLEVIHKLKNNSIKLDIYGHINDHKYWDKCLEKINSISSNHKVQYKGFLHHSEISSTLSKYDFFVLPSLSESFSHAIYESLSIGIPVIISDMTPWKNLEYYDAGCSLQLEEHLWVRKFEEYALISDISYQKLCQGAHNLSMRYLKDQRLKDNYLELFS